MIYHAGIDVNALASASHWADERAGIFHLKVLRIIARLNVGGPARHVVLADRGLRALGYDTLLVFGSTDLGEASLEHLAEEANLPVKRVPALGRRLRLGSDVSAFFSLWSIIRRVRPDIVHTHTAKAGTLGRLAACLANLTSPGSRRSSIVHTFHGHVLEGYFPWWAEKLIRLAERTLARVTDRILVLSPQQQREIEGRFRIAPRGRVSIVPLGLELQPFLNLPSQPDPSARTRLGIPADAFALGYVGRIVPIKNVTLLVEAFANLEPSHATLLIAGDGTERQIVEEFAASRGVSGRVRFLGWCSDLPAFYSAVDAVALSSRNEGTPVALIEAMAAARPVVGTRVGGVPDLVTDGETGLLVESGNSRDLSEALARLAADPLLRTRLGSAARESVRTAYTVERLVADLERIYTELAR